MTISAPTVKTILTGSFVDNANAVDFAQVSKALPQMYAYASTIAPSHGSELEIRVTKTLSAGVRRVAFRIFGNDRVKPITTTSPSVVLGLRKARGSASN